MPVWAKEGVQISMKVLIVETQHCHSEIFPLWEKLFQNDDCVFWQSKKSSKLDIEGLFGVGSRVEWVATRGRPLSSRSHVKLLKSLNPDLIVLNSAETHESTMTVEEIAEQVSVPIIALCHELGSFQRLSGGGGSIFPLTLSELLSASQFTVHASEFHCEGVSPQPEQLHIVVAGTVSPERRHYPFLLQFVKHLRGDERITILGSCSNKRKWIIRELTQETDRIRLNSRDRSFPKFVEVIRNSSALASLVEPDLENFSDYVSNRISGTLNLSIGLQKPLLGHEAYLSTIPHLSREHYVAYHDGNVEEALDELRQNSYEYAKRLKDKKEELMLHSRKTIEDIVKKIGER